MPAAGLSADPAYVRWLIKKAAAMSINFDMTLSGTIRGNGNEVANAVASAIVTMGFGINFFDELAFEAADRSFTVLDRDGPHPSERLAHKLRLGVDHGFVVGAVAPWIAMDLAVGITENTFNCFISIPERKLISFFHDNTLANLYELYGRIAMAMDATGGYGGVDRDWDLLPTDAVLAAILEDPANRPFPASLGILSTHVIGQNDLEARTKAQFVIRPWKDKYWILEEKDFLDVYHSML